MRALTLRLALPLCALFVLELMFRAGAYERLARPDSHAGSTIRMKQAVRDFSDPVDFVTLGSSRAVYGIDHARLAREARARGRRHLNLSMPGSHFTTLIHQARWLQRERPALQGVVIAIANLDFAFRHNGAYEIAIVQPLRGPFDFGQEIDSLFDHRKIETWGAWSALFGYREDIQQLAVAPKQRGIALDWYAANAPHPVEDGPVRQETLCALPQDSLAACAAGQSDIASDAAVIAQCQSLAPTSASRPDLRLDPEAVLNSERQGLLDRRQSDLRAMQRTRRPLVILMPLTHFFSRELAPQGIEAWTHRILDPMVKSGEIDLIDASHFFDQDGQSDCHMFWDLYHQNRAGAEALTEALWPQIESALYGERK